MHLNCLVILESFPSGEKLPLFWVADFIPWTGSKRERLDKRKILPKEIIRYSNTTPIIEQLGTCLTFTSIKFNNLNNDAKINNNLKR
ncbi:hypothetical protein DRW42_06945 [Pedobacter miscanthi]|uniref:Uncharacterized protein n=1 Tax=Pedobacter miscanthi TaxID=2259170 RepID=A0A366L582_9SPHI|nr:hypothetical protein DRW42_06945 [Pedobacter miscanthi]